MNFLCDTNIISELVRPQPNPGVLIWVKNLSSINISVITLEEIHYGLTSKPNLKIQNWFDNFIKNDEIAQLCGKIRGQQRLSGKTVTQADMMIAATAQIHQLTLVTRNIRDFDSCGIPLFNPFS